MRASTSTSTSIHEMTSPQPSRDPQARLEVRLPGRTVATIATSSRHPRALPAAEGRGRSPYLLTSIQESCNAEAGHPPLRPRNEARRGSSTCRAPSRLTQPGMTIVCGDSHTSTHGAFCALAHGID